MKRRDSDTRKTKWCTIPWKMQQWYWFLSQCQSHKHAAEKFVLKQHKTVCWFHAKYYWICPGWKTVTLWNKNNQNGAMIWSVPLNMPNPQTCSRDICPESPRDSMVFSLKILLGVPKAKSTDSVTQEKPKWCNRSTGSFHNAKSTNMQLRHLS